MKTAVLETKAKPARSRYERLEARISPELKELLLDAAALRGVTLSDFLINSAHDAAVETVERHKIVRLSREASLQFAEALLNPPGPNAKLRAVRNRYQSVIKAQRKTKGQ